jgi:hypothetical protein
MVWEVTMKTLTLGTALANVRSLIDEPVENFWKDAEIKAWINAGQNALCSDVGIETVTSMTMNGATVYNLSGMKNIWKVEIIGSGVHTEPLAGRDYVHYADAIRFSIPVTAWNGCTMNVYGTTSPEQLTLDADTFSVDDEYAWGAIYFAAGHCVRKDEAFSEDSVNMTLFRDIKVRREQSILMNIQAMVGPMHYYDRIRSVPPVTGAGLAAASKGK